MDFSIVPLSAAYPSVILPYNSSLLRGLAAYCGQASSPRYVSEGTTRSVTLAALRGFGEMKV